MMLSCDEALERILACAIPLGSERVALSEARGRVLAEALFSTAPIPPTDRSAMDGYAVRTTELSTKPGHRIRVVGESQTGHSPPEGKPGTACRIFTGAVVPSGFDSVVMQENTERHGDELTVLVRPRPGENIRRRGEDLETGVVAIGAGTRLGPPQLALVASLDRVEVVVRQRPRVSVLCTGDELRSPGAPGEKHRIPDSNSVLLSELIRHAGAISQLGLRGRDDVSEVAKHLEECANASDLVVTVGGASVGEHDVVQDALRVAGGTLEFWKVKIKPGKPMLFGTLGRALVLGLPGNPVSAWITFARFGLPLLRALQGDCRVEPRRVVRPIAGDYLRKGGRQAYVLASITDEGVLPLRSQSSGSVVALGQAETLIELAEDRVSLTKGELVDTIDVDSL